MGAILQCQCVLYTVEFKILLFKTLLFVDMGCNEFHRGRELNVMCYLCIFLNINAHTAHIIISLVHIVNRLRGSFYFHLY